MVDQAAFPKLLQSCKVTGTENQSLYFSRSTFTLSCNNGALTAEQRGVNNKYSGGWINYLWSQTTRNSSLLLFTHTHTHRITHTLFCVCVCVTGGRQAGVVRRAIIAIHSKDDLPRPSPSSPPLEDVWGWVGSPFGRWWNSKDGIPLGPRVLLHLLPLRTYREIALGISLLPLLCLIPACETSAASPGARTGFVRNV